MNSAETMQKGGGSVWLYPRGAFWYGMVVLLLVAGIHGLFLHEFGWRWLGDVRSVFVFGLYGAYVASIRFFKFTSEAVTVYSFWGLRRKHVRLDDIRSVYGRWEENSPAVYVRCHEGQLIRLNSRRCKLCGQLLAQLRMRLGPDESRGHSTEATLPEVSDSYRFDVVAEEWVVDYGMGLFLLLGHGILLYHVLLEKGLM